MPNQFKLRTITYFIDRQCGTDAEWAADVHAAAGFLRRAEALYTGAGYEVQTLRVATRALAGVGSIEAALALAACLERAAEAAGLSFLNLGSTSDPALLAALPRLSAASLARGFTSFSWDWQPDTGPAQARAAAAAILAMAAETHGAGNFRFGVSFNCPPEIPYFPAAKAGARRGFAIGTENSGLLFSAFSAAAAEHARLPGGGGGHGDVLALARRSLAAEMEAALRPVEALALQLAAAVGQEEEYLGIDASIAPALERPSLADAYEALGLGRFGGSGTLAISALITGVLKALPVLLTGYCGLMLPVCEDSGLAEAADRVRMMLWAHRWLLRLPAPAVVACMPHGHAAIAEAQRSGRCREASASKAYSTSPPSAAAASTRCRCRAPAPTRPRRRRRGWRAASPPCSWTWRPWPSASTNPSAAGCCRCRGRAPGSRRPSPAPTC